MKYHQGTFVPKNPSKYAGDVNAIKYRSGWERKAMVFFDENPSILKWSSEELIIPYISPVDNLPHRYFVDFLIRVKTREGKEQNIVVEIKPHAQCHPPKQKKQTKRMITEMTTYLVNQAKWSAATEWCKKNNATFQILDEYGLGIAKRK